MITIGGPLAGLQVILLAGMAGIIIAVVAGIIGERRR